MRQALRHEPEGLEFFERFHPLASLEIELRNCAMWMDAYALPASGKHVSGARLSKKRKGEKGRTKQPILRALDIYTVMLLAYLRLIDNEPHSNAVAKPFNAAAEASGVAVTWRLDGHWVGVTEKRFQTERSRLYEVVKRRVAIYDGRAGRNDRNAGTVIELAGQQAQGSPALTPPARRRTVADH